MNVAEQTESSSPELSVDDIIAELDAEYTGKLPVQALREAQRRREEITPRLIDLLCNATAEVRAGKHQERSSHLFALFLLAEFEAKEALPAILEAISLPDDGPFELFGDAITEDLRRVLATLAVDTPEVIDELIANESLNEYVRWAAAGSYLCWVRDGRLTREEAVEHLRCHLREAVANEDCLLAEGLVSELISYSPREALPEIREAFQHDLIDPLMVNMDDVELSIAEGQRRFQQEMSWHRMSPVVDTVAELESWASFRGEPEPKRPAAPSEFEDEWDDDAWDDDGGDDEPFAAPTTIRNTDRRVGRNDPCPCGSGKKYKKCCGAN
jgi:hypothetical protein